MLAVLERGERKLDLGQALLYYIATNSDTKRHYLFRNLGVHELLYPTPLGDAAEDATLQAAAGRRRKLVQSRLERWRRVMGIKQQHDVSCPLCPKQPSAPDLQRISNSMDPAAEAAKWVNKHMVAHLKCGPCREQNVDISFKTVDEHREHINVSHNRTHTLQWVFNFFPLLA